MPDRAVNLLYDLDDAVEHVQGGAVSIGNFDGVHRGHGTLLNALRGKADKVGGPAIVLTFDPHPATVLRPDLAPMPLTWLDRRAFLLQQQGIDHVIVARPTPDLLALSPEAFFNDVIVRKLAAKAMAEGPNFFFGSQRSGNIQTLSKLCQTASIDLQIVDALDSEGTMISSTQIRQQITDGQIDQANQRLTANYCIRGLVTPGAKRGAGLGFPTANLSGIPVLLPKAGVYGGSCYVNSKRYVAAIHIGPNPTFDEAQSKVEVHLLEFEGDLYGETIEVELIHRVRDIRKFADVSSLLNQLKQDILAIRTQDAAR